MEITFGALGILGGVLCAIGDVLFDYKGKSNETLGKHKFIESNWVRMADWRFKASAIFASVGVPMYFLGFTGLAMQITNQPMAMVYWIACLVGSTGGVLIHALLCVFPVLYKKLLAGRTFAEIEGILNALYDLIKIPFYFHYVFLVIVSSVIAGAAIICGFLPLPVWMIIFTPLWMMLIGALLKKAIKQELPGITSIGIAITGLMAILSYNA